MTFVVTIDGPGAAGKSTTARAAAAKLEFLYLDTGALYRALALRVRERGISPEDRETVERCASEIRVELSGSPLKTHVTLDGVDVSEAIRTPEVSELASRLAAQPGVRRRLVELQRELGRKGPVVAEGRDLGTVVFPEAEVKIFLQADLETRVRRRYKELQNRRIPATLDEVRAELAQRDERDRNRSESPLRPAPNAIVIDTTGMDVDAQTEAILGAVRSHPGCPGRRRDREGPVPGDAGQPGA